MSIKNLAYNVIVGFSNRYHTIQTFFSEQCVGWF